MKHLAEFITEAGRVAFQTPDGRRWRMRQPTPEEAASGDSAYRLMYETVMKDGRLRELARDEEALRKEARIRAVAAEAMYMIPLLLEAPPTPPACGGEISTGGGEWGRAFDVFRQADMAEFEELDEDVLAEMTQVYLGPIQEAIVEAKKKSPANSD